jgi:hypothetical protein
LQSISAAKPTKKIEVAVLPSYRFLNIGDTVKPITFLNNKKLP